MTNVKKIFMCGIVATSANCPLKALFPGPTARLHVPNFLEVDCGHGIKLSPMGDERGVGITSRPACQDLRCMSLHALTPSYLSTLYTMLTANLEVRT